MVDALEGQKRDVAVLRQVTVDLLGQLLLVGDWKNKRGSSRSAGRITMPPAFSHTGTHPLYLHRDDFVRWKRLSLEPDGHPV